MTRDEAEALHAACIASSARERELAYQRLGRLLYEVAWRRVADNPRLHDLAADAMQESLLIAWQRLEAGRGPDRPERFMAWCSAIVVNKVREGVRRLNPKPAIRRSKRVALSRLSSLDAPIGSGETSLASVLPDRSQSLDEREAEREIRELIREIASIDAISERSRTVLLKGFIEGLDDAELADLLKTSKANIHVIRCRDLAKLRQVSDYVERLRALYS